MSPRKTLVIGAAGQLGIALRAEYEGVPQVEFVTRAELDLTDPDAVDSRRWADYDTIINAAAYTAVDLAETTEGRRAAWAANVTGVAALARVAIENRITLAHVSSDYVFDGTLTRPYREGDALCPLGVYGQTKAAADAILGTVPRHYVVRTSWVIGEGKNFVRTMSSLAERGVDPHVVNDQFGRLSFTGDIARGIRHLLDVGAPFGVYNVTCSGDCVSWADIARQVFTLTGHDPARVTGVSTADYFAAATSPVAARPRNSALALDRIRQVGFEPTDLRSALKSYLGL